MTLYIYIPPFKSSDTTIQYNYLHPYVPESLLQGLNVRVRFNFKSRTKKVPNSCVDTEIVLLETLDVLRVVHVFT